jgi:hypothetical protein
MYHSTDHLYFAWAIFIAAVAALLVYWRVSRAALVLRQTGAHVFGANFFLLACVTQLALFARPFVAEARLEDGSPTIFSVILRSFAAAAMGMVLALAVLKLWSLQLMDPPGKSAVGLGELVNGAALLAPALTSVAFYAALTGP